MFGGLGMWELLLIFFIILLFFGARRLPEIGGSLGKGIKEFKSSVKEVEGGATGELSQGDDAERQPAQRATAEETTESSPPAG